MNLGGISNINNERPKMIDAYTLVYDAMYSTDPREDGEYIILDMESLPFTDTNYEERQKTIQYFKDKYSKKVLNSSLFKLQQIGLVDEVGNLIINGELLMIINIISNKDTKGIIVSGANYISSVAIKFYRIKLDIMDNKWTISNVQLNGIA